MKIQSLSERVHQPMRQGWSDIEDMDQLVQQLRESLVHASERPEIEGRILAFLNRANGPTTAGVAAEMRISPKAAEAHLSELLNANRIWSQPSHGSWVTWHISLEGQHYLGERALLRGPFYGRTTRDAAQLLAV